MIALTQTHSLTHCLPPKSHWNSSATRRPPCPSVDFRIDNSEPTSENQQQQQQAVACLLENLALWHGAAGAWRRSREEKGGEGRLGERWLRLEGALSLRGELAALRGTEGEA